MNWWPSQRHTNEYPRSCWPGTIFLSFSIYNLFHSLSNHFLSFAFLCPSFPAPLLFLHFPFFKSSLRFLFLPSLPRPFSSFFLNFFCSPQFIQLFFLIQASLCLSFSFFRFCFIFQRLEWWRKTSLPNTNSNGHLARTHDLAFGRELWKVREKENQWSFFHFVRFGQTQQ